MRPLAEFAASFSCLVSGSDKASSGHKTSFQIASENSELAKDLIANAKTIVYSSAISQNHPTLTEGRARGINLFHRSELLALISRHYKTIAIAGTHGKSTTSAMTCHALESLGERPSWIIGAPFASGLDSVKRGGGPWLVIEADESDGSFLRYSTFISVLTNIDADHMDYYQTIDRLQEAFKTYVSNTNAEGGVVYCGDHPAVVKASAGFAGKKISYGMTSTNDLLAKHYEAKGLSATSQVNFLNGVSALQLPLPGQHNTTNALAAIGVALHLGHTLADATKVMASFPGVQRRMQRYLSSSGAIIFDDYAHNPGKILSCIAGISEAFPHRRIVACFQPHRFSRISSLYTDFISSFRAKNIVVVVLPVYASGEAPIKGFEPERIAADIAKMSGAQTFSAPTLKGGAELIKSILDPNSDVVVTIGAGDVWQVAQRLSLEL
jgi:UDP-N-acetylmuramate--alanine ligase